jgi:hypothetical protein
VIAVAVDVVIAIAIAIAIDVTTAVAVAVAVAVVVAVAGVDCRVHVTCPEPLNFKQHCRRPERTFPGTNGRMSLLQIENKREMKVVQDRSE